MDRSQLLKGLLEGCILDIIARKETYGYEITEHLNSHGFKELNEGSVYPVLIRLEKKGLVKTESRKSELGPRRKYFSINEKGLDYLTAFKALWQEVSGSVDGLLDGGE